MKTFVKLSNSKSTKYRSLDLHCLLTSLGKQQWKCWTDYQGRERKSLCRKNQAGSCLQRENLRTQGWKGFVDLHKILLHSWVPRSSAWSLDISEPTKPVRAAFASFSHWFPTAVGSTASSSIALLIKRPAVQLQPAYCKQLTCSHHPISSKRKGKRCQHCFLPYTLSFLQHLHLAYPMGTATLAKQSQQPCC